MDANNGMAFQTIYEGMWFAVLGTVAFLSSFGCVDSSRYAVLMGSTCFRGLHIYPHRSQTLGECGYRYVIMADCVYISAPELVKW